MAKEKNLYGNWVVLAPDNELLSYSAEKRAMWYVERDLADIINKHTIRLKFEPRGRNTDDYSLQRKSNKCVVCGTTHIKSLTKHHVIPSMYKKLFPIEFKARSSHDVVVICRDCHDIYEHDFADLLKEYLGEKYSAPLQISQKANEIVKSIMICRTIIKHWDVLPGDRVETLLNDFTEINGWEPDTFDEMDKFIEDNEDKLPSVENSHSKVVVEKYTSNNNLLEFIIMWRQHFLDSMNPDFMPDGWAVDYADFYTQCTPLDIKKYKTNG